MKIVKILGIILLLALSYFIVRKPIRKAYYDYMYEKGKKNSIVWKKDSKLKWSDFKSTELEYSFTSVGIANRYEFNHDLTIDYKSETLFFPLDSYVSDTSDLSYLELQEYRFDLCEIYRRKLERKIMTMKFKEFPKSRKDSVDLNTDIYYDLFEKEWEKIVSLPKNERLNELNIIKNILKE